MSDKDKLRGTPLCHGGVRRNLDVETIREWTDEDVMGWLAEERAKWEVENYCYQTMKGHRDSLLVECDALKKELAEAREEAETGEERHKAFLFWRGVDTPCGQCGGSGRRTYGSTSTWKGGLGGCAMTDDVCDCCWGTGDQNRHGVNLRDLMNLHKEIANLRAAIGTPEVYAGIITEVLEAELDQTRKELTDERRARVDAEGQAMADQQGFLLQQSEDWHTAEELRRECDALKARIAELEEGKEASNAVPATKAPDA